MIHWRNTLRLVRIHQVLLRTGLDEIITASHLFRPLRWAFRAHRSPDAVRGLPRGVRIRLALEELGPIYVKFGQALSTRRDLLPDDIAIELIKLQDRVPPFPGALACREIERALAKPIRELFREFDDTPLASASIAQVHAATLFSGERVVVKVLRPDVEPRIREDVALLYDLADLARRFWPDAKRLRPVEVVAEFEKTILDELDLVREAANAAEIRRHFQDSPMLYIPRVYWDYTRQTVMVMERVHGIPVGDVPAMKAAGADMKILAERGVEIFFTQVFRDNFFHADMHPGNIFVDPDSNRYIAVDFGIVGSLSKSDQRYVAENIHAFFNRDYRRVAEMHVESGWVPRHTRVEEFESAIRSVCEPIFEKPLKEISYGHLLLRLFQTARRYNMEVQPQLVLLQKTLLNIEGLGRELYPDLDLWSTAKPYLEQWFRQQIGPRATLRKLREQFPQWLREAPELPSLIHGALSQANQGQLEIRSRNDELVALRREIRRHQRRSLIALMASSCVISATLLSVLTPGAIWIAPLLATSAVLFAAAWI